MADNNLFELKIIEPDGMFFEGEGEFLEFTSVEGQMGVYKNHIPLTTILEPCVVKIHANGEKKKAAVGVRGMKLADNDLLENPPFPPKITN